GDLALAAPFDLAKTLRRKPREIAEGLAAELAKAPGVRKAEVAGGGYVNVFLDRAPFARDVSDWVADPAAPARVPGHVIVEHTSINPNKAAHIGHLRNAILGDTFVKLLRAAGQNVDVQNYIDNTGVQVADVVVGFKHLQDKTVNDVRALITSCEKSSDYSGAFDYYCWDLYARTSQWYGEGTDEDKAARKKLRLDTLHEIEHGGNDTAEMAELISTAVL